MIALSSMIMLTGGETIGPRIFLATLLRKARASAKAFFGGNIETSYSLNDVFNSGPPLFCLHHAF